MRQGIDVMKSICFYSTSWRGGDGWYTHGFAEGLANALESKHYSLIFLASPMQPQEREAKSQNLVRYKFRAGHNSEWSRIHKLFHTLMRIAEATFSLIKIRFKTSVFVVTFPHWLSVTMFQFILLKLTGAKIIYIVHDPLPHAWSLPKLFRRFEKACLASTYYLADQLVTLTKSGNTVLEEQFGVKNNRLSVVPHGVFDSGKAEPLKNNRKFLIFGMLRSNKSILESINAFKSLLKTVPDAKLVVAGAPYSAEPEYWAECEKALNELGGSVATEIGFVEEARLETLFAECDAVLLPYKNFNSQSGVAVLAALSMRPVIGTAIGGIAELFEIGMCGIPLIDPPDETSIQSAMVDFCNVSVSEWKNKSVESRQQLLNTLSWQAIGKTFIHELKVE
ncbi:glycosyltransferase [Methylophilus sp. 13]|uniref:glycosyltransferase family 4 protein n=1 Tax=Methylophilus sp. 13 TaxID=2781018 RepID=UPI00188FEFEF|nr:glycosyltransferase [Methylophilus sp. 13]MBF5037994.1 glycosyltransferase [Methylophilus sp. 13]